MLCEYGCGNDALFTFKNGKKSCSNNPAKCPVHRAITGQNNKIRATFKGFKQPTKECSNCHKNYSLGNFNKHFKSCSGDSKKKSCICKVCLTTFKSYGYPKTCSKICRNIWLKTKSTEMYASGERIPCGYTKKTCYYESRTHGKIKLMSSYELDVCFILDNWLKSNDIKYWEYTSDRFSYLDANNKSRTYFPDFKVYTLEGVYYIETKGFEVDNDKYKWAAVRNQGHTLKVWFGDDIKERKL